MVYGAVAAQSKEYGKGHELCAGLANGGANGVSRALLHFDLSQLPPKVVVMTATLTIRARRVPADTGTLDIYRMTSGSWSEGTTVAGLADGHQANADCPTCGGTGPCGWSSTGVGSN